MATPTQAEESASKAPPESLRGAKGHQRPVSGLLEAPPVVEDRTWTPWGLPMPPAGGLWRSDPEATHPQTPFLHPSSGGQWPQVLLLCL